MGWCGSKEHQAKMASSLLLVLNKLDRPLGHVSRGMPIFRVRRSINLAPVDYDRALSVRILIDKEASLSPPFAIAHCKWCPDMLAP